VSVPEKYSIFRRGACPFSLSFSIFPNGKGFHFGKLAGEINSLARAVKIIENFILFC
jgi:hypothetical protein